MEGQEYKIPIEVKFRSEGGPEAVKSISLLEKEAKEAAASLKIIPLGTPEFVAGLRRQEEAALALSAATGKVTVKGVQMGTGMQNIGYQVQDLAVQIGSGTSAFRALGQQLPQLLSGFGPVGILLGTVSAVALPLAAAMFNLGDKAAGAGDAADAAAPKLFSMAEAIEQIAKNKGLEIDEDFDDAARAIDTAALRAAALKQEFIETKKAVNALALAQLDLAASLAKAADLDAEIRGKPAAMKQEDWDAARAPLRAAAEAAEAAATKAREVARQALQGDQDRLKTAQDSVAVAADLLAKKEGEVTRAQSLLATERETLATLRLQKEELEKAVALKFKLSTAATGGKQFEENAARKTNADQAEKKLADPAFIAQFKIAQEKISALEKALSDGSGKLVADVTSAKTALDGLKTKLADTSGAVKTSAQTIQADLAKKTAETITALKKSGVDTGGKVTEAAKDSIKAIEKAAGDQKRALNPMEKDAIAAIQKMLADTTPDAAQGGALRAALQGLANSLTGRDKTLAASMDKLIKIATDQNRQWTELNNRISQLEQKIGR